jgi:hypothetical protein
MFLVAPVWESSDAAFGAGRLLAWWRAGYAVSVTRQKKERQMMKTWISTAACLLLIGAPVGHASAQDTMGGNPPANTAASSNRMAYDAAIKQADADYKTAKEKCGALAGNDKDVCMKEAKGAERVAKAEATATRDGTDRARARVAKEKAEAQYDVAKEKCDALKGNDKDVCAKDAKAAYTQATSSIDVGKAKQTGDAKDVAEARHDVSKDRNDANYKAARERCDALSGDAKAKCAADAKTQYSK